VWCAAQDGEVGEAGAGAGGADAPGMMRSGRRPPAPSASAAG